MTVGLTTGQTSVGVSINGGKGKNRGDGVENIESTIDARDTLTIISGGDTNIIGSQAKGNTVKAEIDGDLNIVSLQDTENYKDSQTSWSASASTTGAVSGSYSNQKYQSNYKSVDEQAGIFAGEGGFDITVGGNTNLVGGVIVSEADASKNKLDTGTLTWSDIKNTSEYDSKTAGVNFNSGPGVANKDRGATPNFGGSKDKETSVTGSGISEGTITIRDKEKQKQDISNLDRNPDGKNQALDKPTSKDIVLEKEQAAAIFGEIGFEAVGKIIHDKVDKGEWQPSDPRALALHGIIGGIMAEINGGKFGEGMTTAAINKLVISQLANLRDDKGKPIFSGDELRWISTGLGGLINGNQGAGIADSGTRNNQNLEEMTVEQKSKMWEIFCQLDGTTFNANMTEEELEVALQKKMDSMTSTPQVVLIGDVNFTLPGGKTLPSFIKDHVSMGGTVIYDPKTDMFLLGPSGGGGVSVPSPITGYAGMLYLPKEFDSYDLVQREQALRELFSGEGMSFSMVPGVGMIGFQGKNGMIYGHAIGLDGSVSYGSIIDFAAARTRRSQMTDEEIKGKYGDTTGN